MKKEMDIWRGSGRWQNAEPGAFAASFEEAASAATAPAVDGFPDVSPNHYRIRIHLPFGGGATEVTCDRGIMTVQVRKCQQVEGLEGAQPLEEYYRCTLTLPAHSALEAPTWHFARNVLIVEIPRCAATNQAPFRLFHGDRDTPAQRSRKVQKAKVP